ncbi:MAG: hypothetical protein V4496_05775 [Pseudomonadota bacterium]
MKVVKAASEGQELSFSFIKNLYAKMFQDLYQDPNAVFVGGLARTAQKVITALAVELFERCFEVPEEYNKEDKKMHKLGFMMGRAGACGFVFSPITNFFKILQNNKAAGDEYKVAFQRLWNRPDRYKYYFTNTLVFGCQEFFRCSIFFGVNKYIKDGMGLYEDKTIREKFMICLFSATVTAAIESAIGLFLEPVTIKHSLPDNTVKPPEKFGLAAYAGYYGSLFHKVRLNEKKTAIAYYGVLMIKNFAGNLTYNCVDTTGKQMEKNAKRCTL